MSVTGWTGCPLAIARLVRALFGVAASPSALCCLCNSRDLQCRKRTCGLQLKKTALRWKSHGAAEGVHRVGGPPCKVSIARQIKPFPADRIKREFSEL